MHVLVKNNNTFLMVECPDGQDPLDVAIQKGETAWPTTDEMLVRSGAVDRAGGSDHSVKYDVFMDYDAGFLVRPHPTGGLGVGMYPWPNE